MRLDILSDGLIRFEFLCLLMLTVAPKKFALRF
jgi:hypothetical protein